MTLLEQCFSYSLMTWVVFAAIACCTARFLPWWCILLGQVVVAAIVGWQDVEWVQAKMRKPVWDGAPDLDVVFAIGLLIRIVLINVALLPFAAIGVWQRARHSVTQVSPS